MSVCLLGNFTNLSDTPKQNFDIRYKYMDYSHLIVIEVGMQHIMSGPGGITWPSEINIPSITRQTKPNPISDIRQQNKFTDDGFGDVWVTVGWMVFALQIFGNLFTWTYVTSPDKHYQKHSSDVEDQNLVFNFGWRYIFGNRFSPN